MKKIICMACFAAFSATMGLSVDANAAPTISSSSSLTAAVRARVADVPVVRGKFEQKKTITGFRKPLISRGSFLVVRDKGVLWDTHEPFASSLRLTRTEIVSRSGGEQTFRLSSADQPGFESVSRVLFALLAGDLSQLEQNFDIKGDAPGKSQSWHLVLTPKQPALQKMFAHIDLDGDRYILRVELFEQSGDRTEIRMLDVSDKPATLTAEEGRRFE